MLSKRLGMTLISLALSLCLVGGATFALFTAHSASAENTLVAGTVSLGTPASTVININSALPGDAGEATYTVQYTGSLGAWLAVDTVLAGDLCTCHEAPSEDDEEEPQRQASASTLTATHRPGEDDAELRSRSFTVTIEDGFGNRYEPNTPNQVIKSGLGSFGPWTTGSRPQFTVRWSLGARAHNACKRKSAMLSLQVHGVQARHNTNVGNTGPISWN